MASFQTLFERFDKSYPIPKEMAPQSGGHTDFRNYCNNISEFETFATTVQEIRQEGLITYELSTKKTKRCKKTGSTWTWEEIPTTPEVQALIGQIQLTPGPKGDKGDVGPKGATGAQGAIGPTGAQGAQGAQGPKGDVGTQGAQGPKGDIGTQGAQGPKGDIGPTGAPGAIGAKGATGDVGPKGATGTQGPKGDIGLKGATGTQGPKGDIGLKGATGTQGPIGVQGPKGDKGDIGPKGDTGIANISSSVASTSESTAASSLAVKTAYDKALSAFQSANEGKNAIIQAIRTHNKTVANNATFSELAQKISMLPTGENAMVQLNETINTDGEFYIQDKFSSFPLMGVDGTSGKYFIILFIPTNTLLKTLVVSNERPVSEELRIDDYLDIVLQVQFDGKILIHGTGKIPNTTGTFDGTLYAISSRSPRIEASTSV